MKTRIYPYWGAQHPEVYEYQNRCTDPYQRIEKCMWAITSFHRKTVLDIGAGSGYHAVRYARGARRVFAVDPDPGMRQQMRDRLVRQPCRNLHIIGAAAQAIPLPDSSIDIAHARFAYFFGTRACLPGIREVRRLLKPGGHFFILDVNPDWGRFGQLARRAYPRVFHQTYRHDHTAFYHEQGFTWIPVQTRFRAPDRNILEAVFRLDFPGHHEALLAQISGTELTYDISLYHFEKRKPDA